MKYTEEIFNILSRGGFISANSVSSTVKRYYDALEEDFTEYYYLPHNFFPKLRQLREEKYDLKFKQRLIALIAGDIVWVLAYWIERVIMGN